MVSELTSTNLLVTLEGDASFAFCMRPRMEFLDRMLSRDERQTIESSRCDLVADIGGTISSIRLDQTVSEAYFLLTH